MCKEWSYRLGRAGKGLGRGGVVIRGGRVEGIPAVDSACLDDPSRVLGRDHTHWTECGRDRTPDIKQSVKA